MYRWQRIRYPAPLQVGDTIGVTAPSSGVIPKLHPRLDACIAHLRVSGFKIVEGICLRNNAQHVSGTREERVKDFLTLWKSPDVKAILPPWGGEIAIHLLPVIDFAELAETPPKWILGYSDTSTLLFALTAMTGIATAHGTTLMEMVSAQNDDLSQRWRDVLAADRGDSVELRSSATFQVDGPDWAEHPESPFNLTEETQWRCMQGGQEHEAMCFSGRLLGGCLETLSSVVGTPYGDVVGYKERFSHEGVILYLENAESLPADVCRMLWNMRLAGWFDKLAGIMIGRSAGPQRQTFDHPDALHDVFDDLSVPVVYDADIGHRPPQMTLVNGALASVEARSGRGILKMSFV